MNNCNLMYPALYVLTSIGCNNNIVIDADNSAVEAHPISLLLYCMYVVYNRPFHPWRCC